ncbi:MAG: chemotaxis protein CheA [Deltaproteobacteria bacterium]|nr:chemotaxis protein CheA [Deltaproteobacteria bacterium]
MAIDRDKYRSLFVDESREGLAAIGNELVALERDARAGLATPESAKTGFAAVFRHAHSLKGMGAALGFVRFARLAHHLEDVADLGRQGRALAPEAWDLMLASCDALERGVEAVAAGADDPDPGELVGRIEAFLGRVRSAAVAPSAASSAGGASASSTDVVDGPLVAVQIQIAADATLPQVRAFVVHRALSTHAGYVDTTPAPDLLRQRELPGFAEARRLVLRFRRDADVAAVVAAARAALGVAAVDVVAATPAPAAPRETLRDERVRVVDEERTIRVRATLLDDLIDSVGEVLLTRSRLRALSARLDVPELSELVDELDRLTRELHGRVVAARMTPLAFLAERLPRAVRDLARQQSKMVDFSMTGMDIELDRAILDELQAPLIHLLRNAVDHGHEGDEVRAAKGRSASMKLTLRAVRDRDRVLLELQDDGKGLDGEAIRRKAVERGLIDRERAAALSPSAALELICLPGFSTAEQVTETSGRGVGMDVVKAGVEKIGGGLRIDSRRDHGTTMTLQLPLTVAIIQVLVVDTGAADDAYVIPVARVDRALAVDDAAVTTTGGRAWLTVGERLVPFVDLAAALASSLSAQRLPVPPPGGIAILVGSGRDEVALRVERIAGQEEVVAKPLGAPLSTQPFIAGGTVLADGRAAYILEPARLLLEDAPARVE